MNARASRYATNPLIEDIVSHAQIAAVMLRELFDGHDNPHVWDLALANHFLGNYEPYVVIRNGDEPGTSTGYWLRQSAEARLNALRIPYVTDMGRIYIPERGIPEAYRIPAYEDLEVK